MSVFKGGRMIRVALLRPYDKKYGWGTFRSLYGLHCFEFGGMRSYGLHLWPIVILFHKNYERGGYGTH